MSTLLAAWCIVMRKHEGVELVIDPHDNDDHTRARGVIDGRAVGRAPWELHANAWAQLRHDRELEPRPRPHQQPTEPNTSRASTEEFTETWLGKR